jgi:membrane-bound lytic murein transglycosylase B
MHGELGQTQFMPKSILNYGTGGNLNIAANALASTANFLRAHGWRRLPARRSQFQGDPGLECSAPSR